MASNNDENRLLKAALFYAGMGWSVIPCKPRGKKPIIRWEQYQRHRASPDLIHVWWSENPDANVAVITGQVSGVIVLDVDGADGDATLSQQDDIEPTAYDTTGKGRHYWFRHPGDGEYRNFARRLPGLDFRGDGGYVIVPPSIHPSGREYRWVTPPNKQKPTDGPAWLLDMFQADPQNGNGHAPAMPLPEQIAEGGRNAALTRVAGAMRRQGATAETLLAALRTMNHEQCVPPLEDRELGQIVTSIMRYAPALRGHSAPPPDTPTETSGASPEQKRHHLTDVGNGERLVEQHGKDLRYCHAWGKWLCWDGARWGIDATDEVTRRGKETALSIYLEAAAEDDDDRRKALSKHAARSEGDARIRAMISMASSEPGIPVRTEQIDADPWGLTVKNGTLDLRTGMLREHRREDWITKLAPVMFDPEAKCPTWERFLFRIMADKLEMIHFLQKAVGYALTGDVREQCMFMFYGEGQNGKSTFLETLCAMLGDYATQTPTETFMVKRNDGGISNDVARLRGARFVSAVETEEGRRLAEVLVKQLTGGDRIVARFLHQEFFEFKPVLKLFLAANHKPVIRGTDHAIWRRIRLVPFVVTIPENEIDLSLGEKLKTELSGILNWALDGCTSWKEEGLEPPEGIKNAVEEYRSEMDVLGEFISACCINGSDKWVSSGDLYAAYTEWAQKAGEHQLSQKVLARILQERGLVRGKERGNRIWIGIGLDT